METLLPLHFTDDTRPQHKASPLSPHHLPFLLLHPSPPETLDRREAGGHGQGSCWELTGRGARHWAMDTWPGALMGVCRHETSALGSSLVPGQPRGPEGCRAGVTSLEGAGHQCGFPAWGLGAVSWPSPSQKANVICHSHCIAVRACPCALPGSPSGDRS